MVFILYQTDFDVNLTLENPKKKEEPDLEAGSSFGQNKGIAGLARNG